MTEFERYLGTLLLNSGEVCCQRCVHCTPPGELSLCDNLRSHPDTAPDDDICIKGMREYAVRHGLVNK